MRLDRTIDGSGEAADAQIDDFDRVQRKVAQIVAQAGLEFGGRQRGEPRGVAAAEGEREGERRDARCGERPLQRPSALDRRREREQHAEGGQDQGPVYPTTKSPPEISLTRIRREPGKMYAPQAPLNPPDGPG